jgi:hypothetical protein
MTPIDSNFPTQGAVLLNCVTSPLEKVIQRVQVIYTRSINAIAALGEYKIVQVAGIASTAYALHLFFGNAPADSYTSRGTSHNGAFNGAWPWSNR